MDAEDLASTLAREVVAYTKLRDRSSHLALVIRLFSGREYLTVIAPIVNGQQILRILRKGVKKSADYDCNNMEGVAVIVESWLSGSRCLHLCMILDSGALSRHPLASWDFLSKESDHHVKLEKIREILKSLLTIE